MKKYTKTKLKLHPREGMDMETEASPFIRVCIGVAILLVATGLCGLMLSPLAKVIVG